MSFQMLILIFVLRFAAHSQAKWNLQNNVYVIDSLWIPNSPSEKVQLHCNVSGMDNESVYWNKDNEHSRHGASCEITVKEPRDAGNFTCWSATKELLCHTTLYVAKINRERHMIYQILKSDGSSNSKIKCTANNFSGNFTCSWMISPQSQHRRLKFAVTSLNTDASRRVTCEEPIKDALGKYSVSCKEEKPCPYTAEFQPVKIVLHVFDKNQYENDTLSFFIKDIIKPDVTECKIASVGAPGSGQLTWKPPQTWSTPASYFGLTYQIRSPKLIYDVDSPTQLENGNLLGCSINLRGNKRYSVRSRERYNKNATWSEWSKPCSEKNDQNHHTSNAKINLVPCKLRRAGSA